MKRALSTVISAAAFLSLCFLSPGQGMAQGASGLSHVFFIGATAGTQHVYQVYGSTTLQDVTVAAGAPVPASLSTALTSYSLSDGAEHVYFISANQHVNELVCCWTNNDISAAVGGPYPTTTSPLTSYVDSYGEHIVYLAANQDVYLLFYSYSTSKWSLTDLTTTTGGALAATNSSLSSFADRYGEYISYEGTNQHIYWMYLNFGHPWGNQDITAAAGGVQAASGTELTSYADRIGEWTVYQGTNNYIYFLSITSYWSSGVLTLSDEPQPLARTNLTSWVDSSGGHVCFVSTADSQELYEYFYNYADDAWNGVACGSSVTGSVATPSLTSLVLPNGDANVFYVSNFVDNPPGTIYCSICVNSGVLVLSGTEQPENVFSSKLTSFVEQ